ncbi:MAG: type I DNA topoisomerase [candidate division WOR-3 bacterium]
MAGKPTKKRKSSPRLPTGINRPRGGGDKRKLLIVESPTKAHTLKGYLGKDFNIMASQGHLVDLPKSALGVEIENNFEPKYIVVRGKAGILKSLRDAAANASKIFMGTDPDREGEAIAFHIAEDISKYTNSPIKRVLFYEITKEEVTSALAHPTDIDMRKVESQQARRILDRLVGYKVSPFLWKIIRGGLSAGRVQTVALKILVEREKEIKAFVPEKYWVLVADLEHKKGRFQAKHPEHIKNFSVARELSARIGKKDFLVDEFKVAKRKSSPPPPHKTSTLQQEASNLFGFSPVKTMSVAQSLYEGVDLPEGRTGLITYMRTDSVRMADKAVKEIRELISETWGETFLSEKPRVYQDKAKGVQAAHECIRPTDPNRTPESIRGHLSEEQFKIYSLIWRRAVASQAKDALFETHSAKLHPDGLPDIPFQASGRKLLFEGFYRITGEEVKAEPLPPMKSGDRVKLIRLETEEKETEPPPRFTEASLIKTLEDKGIGRPSTYATIVSTLLIRGYAQREKRSLVATPLGILVSDILIPNFPEIFRENFTAKMEDELDKIEEGEVSWREVLAEFWGPFERELASFEAKVDELKASVPQDTPFFYKDQFRHGRRGRRWSKKGRGKRGTRNQ